MLEKSGFSVVFTARDLLKCYLCLVELLFMQQYKLETLF